MVSMNISYYDLNDDAKQEFNDTFGPPEDFNHDTQPLFVYEVEESEDEC